MRITRVDGATLRVLLVEDNQAHAELIIRSLKRHKVRIDIYHALDGEMALDFLFRRGGYSGFGPDSMPHVIILDIRMPRKNGLEVLQELKEAPGLKQIPVVILTTSAAEKDIVQAYDYHVNSYLVKPLEYKDFEELMEELGRYWLSWNHPPMSGIDGE